MKKIIMKKSLIALCALAALPTLSLAQSITVGNATGPAGGVASPLPIPVVFAQNAVPTAANTVRDIDNRITYDATKLTVSVTGVAPGTCQINVPGTILVSVADVGTPIVGGTICNLTAVAIAAAAPAGSTPLVIAKGAGSGCSNAAANSANCTYVNGSVTIGGAPPVTAPTANVAASSILTGGVGTVAVNVLTAGNAGGSLALACTIPATGASAFAITAGANRNIVGPATTGANAPAIGLTCVPGAAPVVATLSCAQTPTPASALAPLTSQVTCPTGGPTITPNLLGGTAATPVTLTVANGSAQPIGTVVNITGLTITGAGFVAPATGSWGACTYAADATPPVGVTSDPTAFTAGPQLVFNAANNGTAQPQILGATRRAGTVSTIMTCPVLPVGTTPAATANVYRLVLFGGGPQSAVTAVTPSGNVTLPGYTLPTGSSSTTLTFNVTGVNGALACIATGAGYSATPNPLNLVVGTPGTVTVTYTGAVAGTFTGNLVCNAVAPSTGGPFTYPLSTTVSAAAAVNTVQVPALGNFSLMLLVAGFLGLGMVLVGRRQA